MRVSGRLLVASVIIITVISTLFCIIGLATKGWSQPTGTDYSGLFCDGCYKAPAALSIIAFILLIVSLITLVLLMFDRFHGVLRYVPMIILFVASFFLLATFTSYVERGLGYSFDLLVVAHFASYVALIVLAYWLGQSDAATT
ncbi:hypothetical protein I4U23_013311 [Adineta vaga]|nr:hypothetical protein I4U23_013311 [Adineta vaga]